MLIIFKSDYISTLLLLSECEDVKSDSVAPAAETEGGRGGGEHASGVRRVADNGRRSGRRAAGGGHGARGAVPRALLRPPQSAYNII